jgi:hypothetical protein
VPHSKSSLSGLYAASLYLMPVILMKNVIAVLWMAAMVSAKPLS